MRPAELIPLLTEKLDGQYSVFEVYNVNYSEDWDGQETPHYVATLWRKADAEELQRTFDPRCSNEGGWPASRVKEIGIIILGESAYYDTAKEPVPKDFIANSVQEAARSHVEFSSLDTLIPALAKLAVSGQHQVHLDVSSS